MICWHPAPRFPCSIDVNASPLGTTASLVQRHALFVREFESLSRVVGAIHLPGTFQNVADFLRKRVDGVHEAPPRVAQAVPTTADDRPTTARVPRPVGSTRIEPIPATERSAGGRSGILPPGCSTPCPSMVRLPTSEARFIGGSAGADWWRGPIVRAQDDLFHLGLSRRSVPSLPTASRPQQGQQAGE